MAERMAASEEERQGPGSPLFPKRALAITPEEPRVQLTVGNRKVDFLDTGATYSLLNEKITGLSRQTAQVTGVTSKPEQQHFL